MKIAILYAKNFITNILISLIEENQKKYEIDFYDDEISSIYYYGEKKVQKISAFNQSEYQIIFNFSIPTFEVRTNSTYFSFDSNLPYYNEKSNGNKFNILASYQYIFLKIFNILKEEIKNLELLILKSVASNGKKAMDCFFREVKDFTIKNVTNGYYFEEPIAFNLNLQDNNYFFQNFNIPVSLKLFQTSVIKVDNLYFSIETNLNEEKIIKLLEKEGISYQEKMDSIKLDNENYIIMHNFSKFNNRINFMVTYDSLRNGMAKYCYDYLENN